MAQTPGKTVASKKTASPPKALASKVTKPVAAKPTPSKAVTTKSATTKSATGDKKPSKAVTTTSAKGNGEVAPRKTATKAGSVSGAVTPEQRYRMICDAAYFRAEQRGFIGGNPEQDWRDAENEIDQKLCAVQVQQKNH